MQVSSKLLAYGIAVALLFAYGVSGTYLIGHHGGFNVPINSLVQALYFTVATVTTVGYGDIVPVTDSARVFTMVLIAGGILIIFGAVINISGEFVNSKLERLSGRLSSAEMKVMAGHAILVGYGHANSLVARHLKARRKRFVVVAATKSDADRARAAGYPVHLSGDVSETEMSLLAADRASMVVIDLPEGGKTVYAAIAAVSIAKESRIIAVASSAETVRYLKDIGIGRIINPSEISATKILSSLR